jgi:hypothetical protein
LDNQRSPSPLRVRSKSRKRDSACAEKQAKKAKTSPPKPSKRIADAGDSYDDCSDLDSRRASKKKRHEDIVRQQAEIINSLRSLIGQQSKSKNSGLDFKAVASDITSTVVSVFKDKLIKQSEEIQSEKAQLTVALAVEKKAFEVLNSERAREDKWRTEQQERMDRERMQQIQREDKIRCNQQERLDNERKEALEAAAKERKDQQNREDIRLDKLLEGKSADLDKMSGLIKVAFESIACFSGNAQFKANN